MRASKLHVDSFMWIFIGPCYEHVFGTTHPADGAEALVDPLVPNAGRCVLVFGRQSFVTSVEICREPREKDEMSKQERNRQQRSTLSVTLIQLNVFI